jgi:hypothetical protein
MGVLIGTKYFSGWWSDPPSHYVVGGVDWRTQFPLREPAVGWFDDSQAVMDAQINQMADNGFNFVEFDHYQPMAVEHWPGSNANDNNGLTFFRASPNKSRMKFCLLECNGPNHAITTFDEWQAAVNVWVGNFQDSQHLRINHSPVITFLSAELFHAQAGGQARAWLDYLRTAGKAAGFRDVLIGGCVSNVAEAVQADADGFSFLAGDYASCGDIATGIEQAIDYSTILKTGPAIWNQFANCRLPYVPCCNAGIDRRPLYPEIPPEAYFDNVRPGTFNQLLQLAKAWAIAHSPIDGVHLVSSYAWNELSEGGIIAPTKAFGAMLASQVAAVFGVRA